MKMKKLIILSFLSFLTICSFGQSKFGYIDSSELLSLMPEKKTAEGELQTFAKSLESQLGAMQGEYQASVQDYQANEATYTDLVKQDKIAEIQGLEQRIQSFNQNAQNALQKKEQELARCQPKIKRPQHILEKRTVESGKGIQIKNGVHIQYEP